MTTRTAEKEKTAVQCIIISSIEESEGKKNLNILQVFTSFSCFVVMLKYLSNWETIRSVFSFDSITNAEEL